MIGVVIRWRLVCWYGFRWKYCDPLLCATLWVLSSVTHFRAMLTEGRNNPSNEWRGVKEHNQYNSGTWLFCQMLLRTYLLEQVGGAVFAGDFAPSTFKFIT